MKKPIVESITSHIDILLPVKRALTANTFRIGIGHHTTKLSARCREGHPFSFVAGDIGSGTHVPHLPDRYIAWQPGKSIDVHFYQAGDDREHVVHHARSLITDHCNMNCRDGCVKKNNV
jgi:hypothetical protein